MTDKKDMLEEQIECAIREKGVKARYREMESQMKLTEAAVAAAIAAQQAKSGAHTGHSRADEFVHAEQHTRHVALEKREMSMSDASMDRWDYSEAPMERRSPRGRWIYSFAAAACLLVACVGVDIKESADARAAYQAYVQHPSELYRGSETPLDLKEITEALVRLENEQVKFIDGVAEAEYLEQIEFEKQSLHFNEALYHLSKGHFIRARRVLKDIVASEGAFADDARSVLENM